MLLLQFALIVIDRALFLRKSIVGKLIFQYCLVFGIHLWMFFILPSVTERWDVILFSSKRFFIKCNIYDYRQFNEKLPPQIWYMVKCFYLLLAAYQLRQGYPTRILGNFLCKKYSIVNYILFKGSVYIFIKEYTLVLLLYIDLKTNSQIYAGSVSLWTSGSDGLDLDRYIHDYNGLV